MKNYENLTKKHEIFAKKFFGHFWGSPGTLPGPEKKASLSNRRIGTRNTDSHMVPIIIWSFSDPFFRGVYRGSREGRIRAKIKFFFEKLGLTEKNVFFYQIFHIFVIIFIRYHFSSFLSKKTRFFTLLADPVFWPIFGPFSASPS